MFGYLRNFRSPVGLATRMLRTGNSAAYWAMGRMVGTPFVTPLDIALSFRERKLLANAGEVSQPVLLVVGPPRSGTTFLYQLLAQCLDTTWFPNVSEMFPRASIVASRLFSNRMSPGRVSSFYGQTSGLSGPNDGFHIWNRWFGTDRYAPELRPNSSEPIRQFFAAWTGAFGRPVINKNNRNCFAISSLAAALTSATFVVLRRDESDIARSLIRARGFIQGDRSSPWGLASRDSANLDDPLHYVDDVMDQILAINQRLDREVALVDAGRITELTYRQLCEDPVGSVRTICALSGIPMRSNFDPAAIRVRPASRRLLSEFEERRIASRPGTIPQPASQLIAR